VTAASGVPGRPAGETPLPAGSAPPAGSGPFTRGGWRRRLGGRGVTGRGIGVVATAPALLWAGFAFGYPDLALLGAAAGVAAACAVVFALWRPRLGVDRVAEPDRVARGEPARMTLTVRNTSRLRAANLIAASGGDR